MDVSLRCLSTNPCSMGNKQEELEAWVHSRVMNSFGSLSHGAYRLLCLEGFDEWIQFFRQSWPEEQGWWTAGYSDPKGVFQAKQFYKFTISQRQGGSFKVRKKRNVWSFIFRWRARGSCPEHPVLVYTALGLGKVFRDKALSRTKPLGRNQSFTPNTANVNFNLLFSPLSIGFFTYLTNLCSEGEKIKAESEDSRGLINYASLGTEFCKWWTIDVKLNSACSYTIRRWGWACHP